MRTGLGNWRILVLTLSVLALPAPAAERHLTFRPETTAISWTLGATGHDVAGSFALISGEITWNPETGAARGTIEIDATSAQSGNPRRDRKMHEDVLESARYPRFVLTATEVQGTVNETGSGRVNLHGVLSIHGQEHQIVLPAEVTESGDSMKIVTTLRIPYVEWGMNDPGNFFLRVAKEVEVTVSATAMLSERAD